MSGGYFEYVQDRIDYATDQVRTLIECNDNTETNEWGDPIGRHYPPEIIGRFEEGVQALRKAAVYLRRIDWLVSSDDGETQFLARLREELGELEDEA